jgi:hypothetical protein
VKDEESMTARARRQRQVSVWRRLAVGCLAACAGCAGGSSDSPLLTLPTGLQTGLQPGAYVLEVTGADAIGTDPQARGCRPAGQPPAGRRVTVTGLIARDGDDWVFRSERPGTDVVLRLRVASRSFSTELFAVDGTLRGAAPDQASGTRAASGVTMSAGGAGVGDVVTVDGEIRLTGAIVTALAVGRTVFTDGVASATCDAVALAMQPAPR